MAKIPQSDDIEFGGTPASVPPSDLNKTVAEQALELEALRKQVAALSAKPHEGVQHFGDINESPAGEDDDGNPQFWYRIDLPPVGGTDIRICGVPFYHGQQYKVGADQLRSLKEIVARTWNHEASVRGSNENAYRRPTERVLRGQGR